MATKITTEDLLAALRATPGLAEAQNATGVKSSVPTPTAQPRANFAATPKATSNPLMDFVNASNDKFLGGLGRGAIGAVGSVAGLFSPQAKRSVDNFKSQLLPNYTPSTTAGKVGSVVGDVQRTVVNTVGPMPAYGALGAAQAATGGRIAASVPQIAKLPVAAATRVASDAALAGGLSLLNEGTQEENQRSAGVGGALSAVLPSTLKGLAKLPVKNWQKILSAQTDKERAANKYLASDASKMGLVGTAQGIRGKAQKGIDKIEQELDSLLGESKQTITVNKVVPKLDKLEATYKNIPGASGDVKIIQAIKKDLLLQGGKKGLIPVGVANQIKRDIYGVTGNKYGMEAASKIEGQKAIARGIKEEIEKVVPETADLNKKQGTYIQIKKVLDRAIQRGAKRGGIWGTGISLGDIAGGGGLLAVTGNPVLATGLVAGMHAANSNPARSGGAAFVQFFNDLPAKKKEALYSFVASQVGKHGDEGAVQNDPVASNHPVDRALLDGDASTVLQGIIDKNLDNPGALENIKAALDSGMTPEQVLEQIKAANPL